MANDVNVFGKQVIAEKDEGRTFLYLNFPGAPGNPQKILIGRVKEIKGKKFFQPAPFIDAAYPQWVLREIADILEKENQ